MSTSYIHPDNPRGIWGRLVLSSGASGTITFPKGWGGMVVLTGIASNGDSMGLYLVATTSATNWDARYKALLVPASVTVSVSGKVMTITNGTSYTLVANICTFYPADTRLNGD